MRPNPHAAVHGWVVVWDVGAPGVVLRCVGVRAARVVAGVVVVALDDDAELVAAPAVGVRVLVAVPVATATTVTTGVLEPPGPWEPVPGLVTGSVRE
jgi:hypothetical protein